MALVFDGVRAVALAGVVMVLPLAACGPGGGAVGQAPATTAAGQLQPAQVDLMLRTLAEAPTHGFRPGAFAPAGLDAQLKSSDPAERRSGEARLRAGVVAYARAQHGLGLPKSAMDKNWGMRPPAYDAQAEFDQALAQNRLEAWLTGLPPQGPAYQALRQGYMAYLKLASGGGWAAVPDGPPLKAGSRGPRVRALRERLAFEDPAVAQAQRDLPFDAGLTAAVTRYQTSHGLKPTGAVGPETLASLNMPVQIRAAQIRANLERWRWVPRDLQPTRIEVNSVAGSFDLYVDGAAAMHMLAAAGKPGDETPILTSMIQTVVLNPPWNVPDSIADEELFPKSKSDPRYFAREGFEVQPPGKGVKLVQKPGPKNALGQVKFLFDNDYGVYLHDTPARAAFSRANRSVSHGCVRLERAVDLAKQVLSAEPGWSPEKVDQTLAGAETTEVKLSKPLQVNLFYWTAFDQNGQVQFRDDVYGWDAALVRLLDTVGSGSA